MHSKRFPPKQSVSYVQKHPNPPGPVQEELFGIRESKTTAGDVGFAYKSTAMRKDKI
jgi:hypothetical protein